MARCGAVSEKTRPSFRFAVCVEYNSSLSLRLIGIAIERMELQDLSKTIKL